MDRKEKTALVVFEDIRLGFTGYSTMGKTKRGEGEPLVETLGRLQLQKDAIGLVAKTKYVDGNAVDMRNCEYAGSLKVESNGCEFNGAAATVITRQMPDGARSLVVSDGKNELVLWPNGGWLLYVKTEVGLAKGGHDQALEDAYTKLRGQAREFAPSKESRLPTEGRDEFGGIALDNSPKASGTGFFISADGFLVTNEHVVRDAAQIRLVTSTGLISARVVKVDAANDLALLKAEGRFAALPVAASRGVKPGGTVATVGLRGS